MIKFIKWSHTFNKLNSICVLRFRVKDIEKLFIHQCLYKCTNLLLNFLNSEKGKHSQPILQKKNITFSS